MNKLCPIIIQHQYAALPVPLAKIRKLTRKIYTGECIVFKKRVDLVFCSDYYIKKLNCLYRKKNYATDVLSFPFGDNDFLGEIYISLQRAKIQASRYKICYNDEVIRLFVHGLFHLIGYDHITAKDRNEMEEKEQQYFIVN